MADVHVLAHGSSSVERREVAQVTICEEEGCRFDGGGKCKQCGYRLRCVCGAFVKENAGEHFDRCRVVLKIRLEENDEMERGWL